jgi:hypothetical protein
MGVFEQSEQFGRLRQSVFFGVFLVTHDCTGAVKVLAMPPLLSQSPSTIAAT